MVRVMIYCRLPRLDDNGENMRSQLQEVREYCKAQGYEILEEVTEYHDNRTIGSNLLWIVSQHDRIDAVVVNDMSVICKAEKERELFEKLLNEVDVRLECIHR